jgi:hypothetical protein
MLALIASILLTANTPIPAQLGYETFNEAAVHAAEISARKSAKLEYGGNIALMPNGRYIVSDPKTSGQTDGIELDVTVPFDWKLIGIYHTHPCQPFHLNAYFSDIDLATAITQHLVSVMVDLCTGKVHEFDWTIDPPSNEAVMDGLWLTQGRIIGQIAPRS